MLRCYYLVALLALVLFAAPLHAGNADQPFAKKPIDDFQSNLTAASFASDTIFITKARTQKTYVPPTAVAKRPGHYTIADWRSAIDSTWGSGLPITQKLQIFDTFWGTVDREFACFNNIEVNWDSLGTLYRNEIVNGDPIYGVSRGRFDAIMNHLALALKESHTDAEDLLIYNTALESGIPVMAVGWFGMDHGHFGAGLTPLPDSSLLVYKVVPNHPLGLERGDIVLGYDRIPWKQLYHDLLEAELPMAFLFWGSCPSALEHSFLMSAGLNWHLFDTLDVVKYSTGDTLHLSVAPLIGQNMHLMCSEQMDISGVPMPNTQGGEWVSYGIVEGTQIGYIYGRRWYPEQVGNQFKDAVRDLVENYQTSGLILDFRTNYGGWGILANDGMSYLFNAEELTTDFADRCNQEDHFALCPIEIPQSFQVAGRASTIYDKPVAVLTGPGAFSAGDMNTLKFKFLPTARFFGKSTSTAYDAPLSAGTFTDWILNYAHWNEYIVSEPGQYLTHRELEVDENVWLSRDGVVQGYDDVADAAISWINSVQSNEPVQSFAPESIRVTIPPGESASAGITIGNSGDWPLLYSLTPQTDNRTSSSHGGFDGVGHIWMDSDQPHGPSYNWIDITGIGTRITLSDNNSAGPFNLGFDFPFYGQSLSQLYVGSNGLLTFGAGSSDRTNDPIPSPQIPNNVIAPYWTDLNCQGRSVYYYQDTANQRFIVSFIGIPHYGPTGSLTFQAILYADGRIDFNYGRINPGLIWWADWWAGVFSPPGTIGTENADGTDGLQIAYYENYLHDSLSIRIYPGWLALAPASGHIMPGGSETATVSFRAGNLAPGTYTGNVYLETNDPNAPSVAIPVSMEVEGGCNYVVGDINGNGIANGIDVTYGVTYLKGGNAPPIICDMCPQPQPFYAAGDVNGSCSFNGIDITYFVSYLKGGPALLYCPDCPPAGIYPPAPAVEPIKVPILKSPIKSKISGSE